MVLMTFADWFTFAEVAKGLGAAADRASQAREVFAERGKAPLG